MQNFHINYEIYLLFYTSNTDWHKFFFFFFVKTLSPNFSFPTALIFFHFFVSDSKFFIFRVAKVRRCRENVRFMLWKCAFCVVKMCVSCRENVRFVLRKCAFRVAKICAFLVAKVCDACCENVCFVWQSVRFEIVKMHVLWLWNCSFVSRVRSGIQKVAVGGAGVEGPEMNFEEYWNR